MTDGHTIYLSGPSSRESDETFAWRNRIAEEFDDHEFINPFTYGDAGYRDSPAEIVAKQESALDESDGVLMRWNDNAHYGTVIEARMAYEREIPVVLVNELGEDPYFGKVFSFYHTVTVDDPFVGVDVLCSYITTDDSIDD